MADQLRVVLPFNIWLRHKRMKAGLSVRELAADANVDYMTLLKWEAPSSEGVPSLLAADNLADALGTTLACLVEACRETVRLRALPKQEIVNAANS